MAKKIEEEKVEATNVVNTEEVKVVETKEDVVIGKNPYTLIYSRMSADGKNGEKLEVIKNSKNVVLVVKVTEIVNGNVSVSVNTANVTFGVSKEEDGSFSIS